MLSDSVRRELAGAGCALASAVLFGTMPLMAKTAFLHGGSPAFVASARFLLGSLFCLPLLQASHASWRLAPRQLGHAVLLSLLLSSTLLLLFSAYGGVGTGLATALHFTYPAAVLVLACLVFRVPLSLLDVLCVALAAGGVALLASPSGSGGDAAGIAMAAGSGLTYALYIVLLARSELRRAPVFAATLWLSLFASLETGAFALASGTLTLYMGWEGWGAAGGLGLFSTALAIALFQKSVFLCGGLKTSLYSTAEPLTGVAIGLAVFREPMTPAIGAGMACIVGAVATSALVPVLAAGRKGKGWRP